MWRALLLSAAGCGRVGFGSADAALDAGDVAGDSAPPCTALFCDGFEDPSLATWGVAVDPGATANRDAAFGFRGASLHATSPAGTQLADRFVDVFPVSAPADVWVRVYVFAASGMTLDVEPLHLANVAGTHQLVFSLYDDATDIHAHGFAGSVSSVGGAVPPRDTWVCYELHVAIGANGLVELYRDGALVVMEPAIDTRPPGGDLSRLRVGIPNKPTMFDETLFVDEVAADTTRIGCL